MTRFDWRGALLLVAMIASTSVARADGGKG
jgi:hypothetical protein